MRRFWVRQALDPVMGATEGIYVECSEKGHDAVFLNIKQMTKPPSELTSSEIFDEHCLTPGLLNAHAHLDYSFTHGMLPQGQGFAPWLEAIAKVRRSLTKTQESQNKQSALMALDTLLREGCTEVWDINSFGWARERLLRKNIPHLSFEELIAFNENHWQSQKNDWEQRIEQHYQDTHRRQSLGVSPHATYSVCINAQKAIASQASKLKLPLAIHLAESPEEREMLEQGEGKLLEVYKKFTKESVLPPLGGIGLTAIQRAADTQLLTASTLAIHCNLPANDNDIDLLVKHQAAIIYCPQSHTFFGYPPYPFQAYRHHNARLALGTDGLSSNHELSMRSELRRLREIATNLSACEALAYATGAKLGCAMPYGRRGWLLPGNLARWAIWKIKIPTIDPDALLEAVLDPSTQLERSSAYVPESS